MKSKQLQKCQMIQNLLIYFLFIFGNVYDLQRRLYYESIIDIDSFIFLIGTNMMSESEVKELIQDVIIPVRKNVSNIISPEKKDYQNEQEELKEEEHIKHIKKYAQNSNGKKDQNPEIKTYLSAEEQINEILKLAGSFSSVIETENEALKTSLEKRNKLFEADISQTAKSLFIEAHSKLLKDFNSFLYENEESNPKKSEKLRELTLNDSKKQDTFFFDMLETIERAITESDFIERIKNREIREFTTNLTKKDNKKELQKQKTLFNLGSMFISPSIYISISKMLLISDKDIFIEKMTYKILQPLLTLSIDNSDGNDTEKKENILIFMNDIVNGTFSKYKDEIDEAYKSRSAILEKYFSDKSEDEKDQQIQKIDIELEKRNKELLEYLSGVHAESFRRFMLVNQELINSYARFIATNTEIDKRKVYSFFEHEEK